MCGAHRCKPLNWLAHRYLIGVRFPFFKTRLAVVKLIFAVTQLTHNLQTVLTFHGTRIGFICCYLAIFDKPYATFVNLWLTLFTVTAYLTLFYNTLLFAEPFPHLILRWHTLLHFAHTLNTVQQNLSPRDGKSKKTRERFFRTVRHFDNRSVPLWSAEYRRLTRCQPYTTKSNVGSK